MSILSICVLAIASLVAILILKDTGSVFATILRLLVIILLVTGIIPEIKELLSVLDNFAFLDNVPQKAITIMMKSFSVLAMGAVSADICRDNGENGIAGVVEMCTKLIALTLSLPVVTAVISVASSFFYR